MNDTYAYLYEDSLYLNITNRCTNDCDFCIRRNPIGIPGANLWLSREPSAEEVISQMVPFGNRDVVFCGYGEPTLALDVLKQVAGYVKSYGGRVRINTNGHACIYHKRNVVPELSDCIDTVSVSLNAPTAREYDIICHSIYGENGFYEMINFTKLCVESKLETILSVVNVIDPDQIELCRKLAENIGAKLRVRQYSSI